MSPMLEEAVARQRLAQRRDALERANDVREYRARVKEDLKAARRTFREVVLAGDARLAEMRVYELLVAVPALGPHKAQKWLRKPPAWISEATRVGALREHQEDWLFEMVEQHEGGSSVYRRRRAAALR